MDDTSRNIINRLRTIKGHITGIEKMVLDNKPCADILVQITAVKSSVHKVGMALIEQNAMQCLVDGPAEQVDRAELESVLKLVLDYTKKS